MKDIVPTPAFRSNNISPEFFNLFYESRLRVAAK